MFLVNTLRHSKAVESYMCSFLSSCVFDSYTFCA